MGDFRLGKIGRRRIIAAAVIAGTTYLVHRVLFPDTLLPSLGGNAGTAGTILDDNTTVLPVSSDSTILMETPTITPPPTLTLMPTSRVENTPTTAPTGTTIPPTSTPSSTLGGNPTPASATPTNLPATSTPTQAPTATSKPSSTPRPTSTATPTGTPTPWSVPANVLNNWRLNTAEPAIPSFDEASWRFTVAGLVNKPLSLTYQQLRNLPHIRMRSTLHCVEGWEVPDLVWTGVRVQDILKMVGVKSTAGYVRFVGMTGFYDDMLSLPQASVPDVILAYDVDGAHLPPEHGFPLRLVVPEMYGYKSVKWVARLELTNVPSPGYWERYGYPVDAYFS